MTPMPQQLLRHPVLWLALAGLAFPLIAGEFWVGTVAARVLIIGTMALSLTFLTSSAGLVSFAQAGVAGVAGYTLALLSPNITGVGMAVPWPLAVGAALVMGTLAGLLVGWVSVRSSGIYLLMITLAMSVSLFYLVSQNTEIFNGFDGINGLKPPELFGMDLRAPIPFYGMALAAAVLSTAAVMHLDRTPFGLQLHALRNAPRRVAALGFSTTLLRIAAFGVAGLIASVGGVLNTWFSGQMSPGAVDVHAAVSLLVVAVLGGIRHPLGAFLGAAAFVLLENYAASVIDRERFNLVIGAVFIVIVLFAKDGLIGVIQQLRARIKPAWTGVCAKNGRKAV